MSSKRLFVNLTIVMDELNLLLIKFHLTQPSSGSVIWSLNMVLF